MTKLNFCCIWYKMSNRICFICGIEFLSLDPSSNFCMRHSMKKGPDRDRFNNYIKERVPGREMDVGGQFEFDPSQLGEWDLKYKPLDGLFTLMQTDGDWARISCQRTGANCFVSNDWYPVRFLKPFSRVQLSAAPVAAQYSGEPGEPGAAPVAAPVAPALPLDWWNPANQFRTGEPLGSHVELIRIGWRVMLEPAWLKTNPEDPHLRKPYTTITGTVIAKNIKEFTVKFDNGCLGVDLDPSELVFVKAGTEDATVLPDDTLSRALTHAMGGKTPADRAARFGSYYRTAVQPSHLPAYSPVVRASSEPAPSVPAQFVPAPSVPAPFVPSVPAPVAHGGGYRFSLNPPAPAPAPAVWMPQASATAPDTLDTRIDKLWAHDAFRVGGATTVLSRADATRCIAGTTNQFIIRQSGDAVPDGERPVRYVIVFNSGDGQNNLKFEVRADGLILTDGTDHGATCPDLDAVLRAYGYDPTVVTPLARPAQLVPLARPAQLVPLARPAPSAP